jgi:hypothetical protein
LSIWKLPAELLLPIGDLERDFDFDGVFVFRGLLLREPATFGGIGAQ